MPKTLSSAASADAAASQAAGLAAEFQRLYRRALAQRSDAERDSATSAAAAEAARTLLAERWAATQAADAQRGAKAKRVHYLSMEFLMGRAMHNALAALGLDGQLSATLGKAAPSLQALIEHEPDAALGNGGLGRLAACFLDAFASLGLPSFGYGLRYEHGMFAQLIQDGRQIELPDEWLRNGNPWELLRPELRYPVGFGGMVVAEGGLRRWVPAEIILAQAYDFIVPGHATERVSTLRQWNARPCIPSTLPPSAAASTWPPPPICWRANA
ncbi:glycogen/starch/alpha-glucan phosphorylase [Paucibacter sp. O1-1]|nr:glycogen/starch/alpha-glucan phosphorylase [Paucibacter sp. O1-1]MDA3831387.1 glycogen/starch/alpha-glucan phosphorylase [Paucibacter sp. O1-1]